MNDSPGSPKDTHYAKLRRAHRRTKQASEPKDSDSGLVQLYGLHTVAAALENPVRRLHRLRATRNALARLPVKPDAIACPVEEVLPRDLDRDLGADAVHQGLVLDAEPLAPKRLNDLGDASLLVVLDQITDPHNVGAILRSAVAFGADAVLTTHRHSPQESGVLAKAASGALEHVPIAEVRNLAEGIETLRKSGFRLIGLDSDGPEPVESALSGDRIAFVLGAEGKGLRQKTRQTVDVLARLEMPGAIRSLNVSNAAAISLYLVRRHLSAPS